MRIVCDENIPLARELFGRLGEVHTCAGRSITAATLAGAELLVVRSVTRVDEGLLRGSGVRFVASATIGVDHIDLEYLSSSGIAFAHAPGCNAGSVAQYVTAAVVHTLRQAARRADGLCAGVVGVGNVGTRVAAQLRALGMQCLLNDPPLARAGGKGYVALREMVGRCDVLSLHVPLTLDGQDATLGLIGAEELAALKPGAVLLNTSRGGVVDEDALVGHAGRLGGIVLDVWTGEPLARPASVRAASIATPHIAGYSMDGKVRGTHMVYEAACRYLGVACATNEESTPPGHAGTIDVAGAADPVAGAVLGAYAIGEDDARMRRVLELRTDAERAAHFDRLRRDYPVRLEPWHYRVRNAGAAAGTLSALGFVCE